MERSLEMRGALGALEDAVTGSIETFIQEDWKQMLVQLDQLIELAGQLRTQVAKEARGN